MLDKIKSFLFSYFLTNRNFKNKDFIEKVSNHSGLSVQITWDDILNGIPNSSTDCSIAKSLKREGYINISVSNHFVLVDGSLYYPIKFSDHWKCYINSKKLRPLIITYTTEVTS